MKYYQVFNFQDQPVKVFKDLYEAKQHILSLQEVYSNELFYVVELNVVYVKDTK